MSRGTERTLSYDAAAPRRLPIEAGARVGRYEVLRAIGAGAMGEVFAARDPDLDRDIAIKVLHKRARADDAARSRLLAEAQAMAQLQHPNVVTVNDVGLDDGRVYIAMELVDGPTPARLAAAAAGGTGRRRSLHARGAGASMRPIPSAWCTATSSRTTSCSTCASGRRESW